MLYRHLLLSASDVGPACRVKEITQTSKEDSPQLEDLKKGEVIQPRVKVQFNVMQSIWVKNSACM